MAYTILQGDLLLDVFESCSTLTALFDQKQTAQQEGSDADLKEVMALYKKECEHLAAKCEDAITHGVSRFVVRQCCEKYLPEQLVASEATT